MRVESKIKRGTSEMKKIQKVGAFIIRPNGSSFWDLLLFLHCDHPDAPIQIPGGTIEPGERVEEALMREIEEESGLTGLTIDRKLGVSEVPSIVNEQEVLQRHCFLLKADPSSQETWIHHVKGTGGDRDLRFEYRWHSIPPDFTLAGDLGFFLSPQYIPELYENGSIAPFPTEFA
jgi:8-oxo-dGTP pyrophosphatase MutT (NUDIX family)